VTKGAVRGHLGWARRVAAHPVVAGALAEGNVLTESIARTVCGWTGQLPQACRDTADAILVAAARAGARQQDLAELAAEIYARSLSGTDAPQDTFEDRKVILETTYDGAGVISGDLIPECAAVVTAVLESCPRPEAPRTPGPGLSDTTTHWRRRCPDCVNASWFGSHRYGYRRLHLSCAVS
jgi:Domain of unknown function (DUF222)